MEKLPWLLEARGSFAAPWRRGWPKRAPKWFWSAAAREKANARLRRIEEVGGRGYFIAVDLSRKAGIEAVLEEVIERSGKVDILVNGAGANSPTPFFEIEEEEYDWIFAVNMKAVFLTCQVFGEYLVKRGRGGSIINLGSMSGVIPLSRVFTYSATKASVP